MEVGGGIILFVICIHEMFLRRLCFCVSFFDTHARHTFTVYQFLLLYSFLKESEFSRPGGRKLKEAQRHR